MAYGNDAAALADFGLPVRKKGVLTPAQRIAATAKAKATRAARHTMGPKQKATVTGNVTGVTITPVVSTSSVAAAGQPAVGTVTTTSAGVATRARVARRASRKAEGAPHVRGGASFC